MPPETKVIHVEDVPIERMQERDGWAISEFRLPISGKDGSATTIFHSIFRPGSTHAKHVHHNCDEMVAYLDGHGVGGQSEGRVEIEPGHRRLIPQGSEHFLHNESDKEALVIGFYVGAGSVVDSGYEHRGDVTPDDVRRPLRGVSEGTLVRLEEVDPVDLTDLEAWSSAEVRMSIGIHTQSDNALIDVAIPPRAAIDRHLLAHCEQLYYVVEGNGRTEFDGGQMPIRAGHVIFVPRGSRFAVENADEQHPLKFVGVLTGAGSLAVGGYAAT